MLQNFSLRDGGLVTGLKYRVLTGFGEQYVNPSSASLFSAGISGFSFSPSGDAIIFASSEVGVVAYKWSTAFGFGSLISSVSDIPQYSIRQARFSPAGNAVAVAYGSPGILAAYPWSLQTGFGSRFPGPSVMPTSQVRDLVFSPTGDSVIVFLYNFPYIIVYSWSSLSGFGSVYPNPPDAAFSDSSGACFSPSGDAIVIGSTVTSGVQAYSWSAASGFGSRYPDPSPAPVTQSGDIAGIAFSPNANAIVFGTRTGSTTLTLDAYKWSSQSGFGAKYAQPPNSIAIATSSHTIDFHPLGTFVAVGHGGAPGISVFPFSLSEGFGSRFNTPVQTGGYTPMAGFSPQGDAIIRTGNLSGTGQLHAYRWNI